MTEINEINEIDGIDDSLATGIDPADICTLSEGGLAERLRWVEEEILPHALRHERGARSISWELSDTPGLSAKLDQLIAMERQCCQGIAFRHYLDASGVRRLEVDGIDSAASVFSRIARPAADPSPGKGSVDRPLKRIAQAAGLGTLASLFVCCLLPIGIATLLGGAAAMPFASLDQPAIIAGAALLGGGAAYLGLGRRQRRRAAPSGASVGSCADC